MIHKVVSFFANNLDKEIVLYQKKVFDYFNVNLEQIEYDNKLGHGGALTFYLNENTNTKWDMITIFDVDCVPTNDNFLNKAIRIIEDENTIYGNAQATAIFEHHSHKSIPFIAPSFLNFTKKVWIDSTHKSFETGLYPNPNDIMLDCDVAEEFTRENEKQGRNIVYAYPTYCYSEPIWKYDGWFGYPKFEYGIGTEFESGTFHNFQIRFEKQSKSFIPFCKKIIKENTTFI